MSIDININININRNSKFCFCPRNIQQSSMHKKPHPRPAKTSKPSPSKTHQKQLHSLTEQVQNSRIAVQQISKNRQQQQQSSKIFSQIKNQLNLCMLQIHTQQKRQHTLKQLITLLKGQMSKIEAKELEIKQREEQEVEKKIRQLRDDIDKICSRKNHQVARITELKELANQGRSERVVYSNLFKKLEKELKDSEEAYKNQILRSERNKLDLALPVDRSKSRVNHESKPSSLSSCCHTQQHPATPKLNPRLLKTLKEQPQPQQPPLNNTSIAINLLHAQPSEPQLLARQSVGSQVSRTSTRSRQGHLNSTKENMASFEVVTQQLIEFGNRVKGECGVASVREIKQLMEGIQGQNQRLEDEIRDIDGEIQMWEGKVADGDLGEDQFGEFEEEIALHCSIIGTKNMLEMTNRHRHKFSNTAQTHTDNETTTIFTQFSQLCTLLNLPSPQPHTNSLQTLQKCQQIDTIISQLLPFTPGLLKRNASKLSCFQDNERDKLAFEEGNKENMELTAILSKMNRFEYCQKFLDRTGFHQQYHKELTRKTKFRSKKL